MLCAPLPAQRKPSNGNVVFPPERVPNLGKVKQLLKDYHDCRCRCGCYAAEMNKQARRAMAFLERRAAARRPREKLAIVLDIDETSLSTYQFRETTDLGYIPSLFDQWVRSAQAPAIESTLRLFQKARQLQVAVFFISWIGAATDGGQPQEYRRVQIIGAPARSRSGISHHRECGRPS